MARLGLLLAGIIFVAGIGSDAAAQSALERLEKRLNQRPAVQAPIDDERPAPAAIAEPGYLGAVTDDRIDRGRGVRIVEAVAGGPAEAAGLQAGDVITSVDDQPVRRMSDLAAIIQTTPAGERLTFQFSRDGQRGETTVTLAARPAAGQRRFRDFGRVPDDVVRPAPIDEEQPELEGPVLAAPADDRDARIEQLERRVAELEQRLAAIEALLREDRP
jgi:membrane-associated protease RseP (regulator of RpoE activity)